MYTNEYNLKRYYFLETYTKIEEKYCTDPYNRYSTVANAKEACDSDSMCRAVYDPGCYEKDTRLCPVNTNYVDSPSSCIYVKGKNCIL